MQDYPQLLSRLSTLREATAALKPPKNPQLRAGYDNALKDHARQEGELLDHLAASLHERARPVVLVGGSALAQSRFTDLARRLGAVTADASAPYDYLAEEVGVKQGVLKLTSTKVMGKFDRTSVPTKRQQLTADMLRWVQQVSLAKWTAAEGGSYHGRKAALATELAQPAAVTTSDVWFQDWPSLISVVKAQFRTTNREDQVGRCGVLDALRQVASDPKVHEDPVVVVHRVDSLEEAANLSKLFVHHSFVLADSAALSNEETATFASSSVGEFWPAGEIVRKFVTDTINRVKNANIKE